MENNTAIKIQGVKKMYRLGQIGGGTLQGDLQSWWARKRGKEDPNTKIGTDQRLIGQTFMALNGVDLEIKQGEAIGIIGKNGAGKSTLLKLLSRVTAPTEGTIDIWGRIASMLEVGTGFHPEMTGRENVYMNGAILGMTRAEIDSKMDQIIEFSEVGEFIDTPVKRYSSGMYVKLAFSVAAHLDSEIMIMDEVLAVGDMAFQRKCLTKMREESTQTGKTILYVSHNMKTIRDLCTRCVVLEQGRIIYDGNVEEAISIYLNNGSNNNTRIDYTDKSIPKWMRNPKVKLSYVELKDKEDNIYRDNEDLVVKLCWINQVDIKMMSLRAEIHTLEEQAICSYLLFDYYSGKAKEKAIAEISFDIHQLADTHYQLKLVFFEIDEYGNNINIGFGRDIFFEKTTEKKDNYIRWSTRQWGYVKGPQPVLVGLENNIEENDNEYKEVAS